MEELSKKLLIWIIVIIIAQGVIRDVINIVKRYLEKKKIKFHEFDDISIKKIKKQEQDEKEQLDYERKVLNKIRKETDSNGDRKITLEEIMDTERKIEKAKKDFENFKRLDSVEVEDEKITEGNAVAAIKEHENNFEIELFKTWTKELFKCIKIASIEDIELIKKFISEELYNMLTRQQKQLEKDNLDFRTEDLYVEDIKIIDYGKSLNKEEIKVLIEAKLKEYVVNNSDGSIIRGDSENLYTQKYIMTFLKKENNLEEEGFIHNCPNCQAAIQQTELGKCKYCGTLIFPIRYNWTLTKFEVA